MREWQVVGGEGGVAVAVAVDGRTDGPTAGQARREEGGGRREEDVRRGEARCCTDNPSIPEMYRIVL